MLRGAVRAQLGFCNAQTVQRQSGVDNGYHCVYIDETPARGGRGQIHMGNPGQYRCMEVR